MPFFQLSNNDLTFPPAYFADTEGLIAVGGDLSPERVLEAYRNGIYFWYGPMDPIKWWSPDPRIILLPGTVVIDNLAPENHVIKTEVSFDPFIRQLQSQENQGTMAPNWVTEEMANMYRALHHKGVCKIFEVNINGNHLGSIMGLDIGTAFYLEYILSPTHNLNDPNNDVIVYLFSDYIHKEGYHFIDVQKETNRISDIGIVEVSRLEYLQIVKNSMATMPQF